MTWISLLPSEKGTKIQWHRPAIKQRSLEALRLQPLGRTTAVCFSMVLDFIQTIRRTLGKHDQLGIANKMRRQPITATLGKLYVVALFISPHPAHDDEHILHATLQLQLLQVEISRIFECPIHIAIGIGNILRGSSV